MRIVLTEQQREVILKMVYAMEDVVEACADDNMNMFLTHANIFRGSLDDMAYELESLVQKTVDGIEVDF